ncbi:MAG: hypothetical protein J0M04_07155 [Verrucomicrobia bacterium]|nr:hypothetical protein [Verrucomicrobiota bacterium]
MKNRSFWLMIPVALVALGSCEKKETAAPKPAADPVQVATESAPPKAPAAPEKPTAPETPAPAATPAATPVAAAKSLTPAERAEKLGFVRYLPADTSSVITVHNGTKIGERAQSLKLWKVIQEQIGINMNMEPPMPPDAAPGEDFPMPEEEKADDAKPAPEEPGADAKEEEKLSGVLSGNTGAMLVADLDEKKPAADEDMEEDMPADMAEPVSPADMVGQEITVAVGKNAGEQLTNLLTGYERFYYFMLRAATKSFAASVKAGDAGGMEQAMQNAMTEELGKDLINDPESGIGLIDRAQMPAVYVAFRTPKEKQDAVADQIGQSIDMFGNEGEVSEPITIEKSGAKLTGFKLLGSKIVEELKNEREEMDNMLGTENADKLLAAIAKKTLVVASGKLGEYVVIFVGTSEEDFGLTEDPAKSLAAGKELAFADAYADKDLAALIYGNQSAAKALFGSAAGLANYANGIRDGLSGSEGLGETRDLEAMLQMVAERETALRKLGGADALGVVAFFDQGLRVESFGGYDPGALDWKTPCRLSHLGDSPDVAVFLNATADAAYDEKALAYYEALVETAYSAATKFSELPVEDGDVKQFKETLDMFNTNFRTEALALWDAIRGDLGAGLGQESALVVDLKGSMPTFPGVPQTVIDKAKFPRATVVVPVADRAKLSASWTKINDSCTKLLGKISEMAGEDIPMQKPISSEKNGYTTWFMSLPFQTNDFIPSVTVGDKWFAASTSKDRALELLGQAEKAADGRTGLYLKVDFKAFQACAADTLKLLDENAKEIFGDNESMLEQVTATKEMRDKLLDAMTELDSLTVHSRREDGVLRGSVHFKTN